VKKLPLKKKPVTGSAPAKAATKKSSPAKPAVVKAMDNPFNTTTDFIEPGIFILPYGPPGEGKTTVFAHAPAPLFVHTSDEQGIKQALAKGVVPADVKNWLVELEPLFNTGTAPDKVGHPGWIKLMSTMALFEEGNHDRRTLVIDSTSGLQGICHQHCASKLFKGDMTDPAGFMNYYAGYIKAAEQFWKQEFMVACSRIVAKGYNIILLAHSTLQNEPNPAGADFQIFAPDLDKRIWNETKKSVQGVLFMGRCQSLKKDEKRKTKVSAEHRFIGVARETWYEAKNWFNLDEPIDVGSTAKETWDNLNKVLQMS
jgi:hypothetical protein